MSNQDFMVGKAVVHYEYRPCTNCGKITKGPVYSSAKEDLVLGWLCDGCESKLGLNKKLLFVWRYANDLGRVPMRTLRKREKMRQVPIKIIMKKNT